MPFLERFDCISDVVLDSSLAFLIIKRIAIVICCFVDCSPACHKLPIKKFPYHSVCNKFLLPFAPHGVHNNSENFRCSLLTVGIRDLFEMRPLLAGKWIALPTVWTTGAWGPFLESPGNFSGPKSNIQIEIYRIRARVQASKLLHFVSLTDSFIMLDAKRLKPGSL